MWINKNEFYTWVMRYRSLLSKIRKELDVSDNNIYLHQHKHSWIKSLAYNYEILDRIYLKIKEDKLEGGACHTPTLPTPHP